MSKFDNYCGSGPLYWIQQQGWEGTFLSKKAIRAAWRSGGWIHGLPIGPTWDPHLYTGPEDYNTGPEDYNTGPEDHNTGPEDLSIRLSTKT